MAESKRNLTSAVSKINSLISGLYRNTYFTTDQNKQLLKTLTKDIDSSLNSLIDKSMNSSGTNISKLYSRMNLKTIQNDKESIKAMEDIFNDHTMMDNILSTYMENKYIRDLDIEIDIICKYMPKLEEALDAKRDAILSADNFSKDFITIKNLTKPDNDPMFSSNIEEITRIYNLSQLLETTYENTAKYGEQFIYVLPYNKAFTTLLNDKRKSEPNVSIKVNESGLIVEDASQELDGFTNEDFKDFNIEICLDESGVISNIINEEEKGNKNFNASIVDSKKLKLDTTDFDTGTDGLVTPEKIKNIKVNGCIVRKLPRENVIPIYIDEICLGYYYIESQEKNMFEYMESIHDPMARLKKGTMNLKQDDMKRDNMLKSLSGKISKHIDEKFINNNQDLRKEIYLILKHNNLFNNNINKFKITFIPPEDMVHFVFKKDQRTNRGISDLAKSLFPAKLYSCLYITNTIGILTRSHDKRAYFVKQYVDTNISNLLINTINQIKKSNFGMREINNIDHMLYNITGRYNDYVIPVSQSNDKPIDFEIIQGQDIDTKPELMESLESMAINPTGVPLEIIESRRSVEFSRQITVANGKFARHILKRQSLYQIFSSDLITKIYNHHYDADELLQVLLPPPSHLILTNTVEMTRNAKDMTDSILELEVADTERDAPWVFHFKKNLMRHYLSTYVNWDNIDRLKRLAEIQAAKEIKRDDEV